MGMSQKRKEMFAKKRYNKLLLELTKIEKQLYPHTYSYKAFALDDQTYLRFPATMNYPLRMVEMIIKDAKKHAVKEGFTSVGLILEMPVNLFGKIKGVKTSSKSKKPVKKRIAKKKKTVKQKRDNNGRFKKHK